MKYRIVKVKAGVRYFEDANVKSPISSWYEDEPDSPTIPCVVDECWCPEIDPNTGKILNWTEGWEAQIHYKVCDDCEIEYYEEGEKICNNDGEYYVPEFLSPKENGYGDYMIMDIDSSGQIQDWSIQDFNDWVRRNAVRTIIPGLIEQES